VDDILIFGATLEAIQNVKNYISQNFDMEDLRFADMILGMKISENPNGISLSLVQSIKRMLHNDFFKCNSVSTPFDSSTALQKNTDEPIFQLKYSQLRYLLFDISNQTRVNITYAVGRLSRHTSKP